LSSLPTASWCSPATPEIEGRFDEEATSGL
jgi:hypothetical protein